LRAAIKPSFIHRFSRLHLGRGITGPDCGTRRQNGVDPRPVLGCDPHVERAHILLRPAALFCPRDRNDVISLRQQPSER